MGHHTYAPLGRRWHRAKGFRLNSGRFSVLRLRLRFFSIIGLLRRCLESIRKGVGGSSGGGGGSRGGGGFRSSKGGRRCGKSSSRRGLVCDVRMGSPQECKLRPSGRSNTFYADAIADCLEFIKRTSVSVGEASATER